MFSRMLFVVVEVMEVRKCGDSTQSPQWGRFTANEDYHLEDRTQISRY